MKAAVLYGANKIEIRDVPTPAIAQAGEVIADVQFVGLCKTDQQITATAPNQLPAGQELILGHEVVCQIPDEQTYFALNNEISCGKCSYCQEGLTSHCQNLQELGVNCNGGYAQKMLAPRSSLYPFAFSNPSLGILIEPLSCAVRGVERILATANLWPVDQPTTLIIGGGLSGSLVGYLLTHSPQFQGNIKLYDIVNQPILWAEKLGIERITEVVKDKAHLVIECSGSPKGLDTALTSVRKAGLVCIYGVPKVGVPLPIAPHELFMREIAVITSFAGATEQTMGRAIDYIRNDEAFFEQLLGRVISLQNLPQELTAWNPQLGTRTFVDMNI